MDEITSIKEFSPNTAQQSLRNSARNMAIGLFSLRKTIDQSNNWIQFPYYHHVFDDEMKGFERQLRYLKNFGDFISHEEACELISDEESFQGRYFSVSFDDGFSCTHSNMMQITDQLDIPVMIYLPTKYINLDATNPEHRDELLKFHPNDPKIVPFLSWEDCKHMISNGVSFGSHTINHVNLATLNEEDIELELGLSKQLIEKELGVPCEHFACPWGRIGIDFDPEITRKISKKLGYSSVSTTNRGLMNWGDDLFTIKRQHLLANWGNYQLRYFFGQ